MGNHATSAERAPRARSPLTAADVLATLERHSPAVTGSRGAERRPDGAVGSRVPVFRNGRFSGFAERGAPAKAVTGNVQSDAELQRQLTETVKAQVWLDPDHVNVAVEKQVVRLSGCGESMHAVLALRRIAASAPSVAAIIDELWVGCE